MSSTTTTVPPTVVRRPKRRGKLGESRWQGYLFAAPALVLLGVFLVWPVIYTIEFSFHTGLYLQLGKWVGFDNYKRLFSDDPSFLDLSHFPPGGALANNVLWVVVSTALCLGLGLLIAVLATRVRYERHIKAVVFVPYRTSVSRCPRRASSFSPMSVTRVLHRSSFRRCLSAMRCFSPTSVTLVPGR